MIESAIKTAVERITGLDTYPLLLPDTMQEGATFQRISDPQVGDGLRRTGLSEVRIQISLYVVDVSSSLSELEQTVATADNALGQRIDSINVSMDGMTGGVKTRLSQLFRATRLRWPRVNRCRLQSPVTAHSWTALMR